MTKMTIYNKRLSKLQFKSYHNNEKYEKEHHSQSLDL